MKTLNEYTIYCTEEQTKKALELGAPIQFKTICHYEVEDGKFIPYPDLDIDINGDPILIPPTAEQMIGWLEEQGILVDISAAFLHTNTPSYLYRIGFRFNDYVSDAVDYPSRKEATLAAIDAALDYLSKAMEE